MENIVNELQERRCNLIQALYKAKPTADGKLKIFIENELEGYKTYKSLPTYRLLNCPIILDYETPWGDIYRNQEFDGSKLGPEINITPFFENVDTIMSMVDSLKYKEGIKLFTVEMLEMVYPFVGFPEKGTKLIRGGYRFDSSHLESILGNAKKKFIQLANDKDSTLIQNKVENQPNKKPTSVFVSYAWESDEQNTKVISFVDFLRKNGFEARMDKSEMEKESSINLKKMMHKGIYESDKVIVILSEKYKQKADQLIGGVGEEITIIQEEISRVSNKYIL